MASRARHRDHAALDSAVQAWLAEAERADWSGMSALKAQFRNASPVTAERVVFNIKGNDYRLVAAIDFEKQILWIKWIGTHDEYDRIDVKEVQTWQISS